MSPKGKNNSLLSPKNHTETTHEFEFPHEEYQIEPFFKTSLSSTPLFIPSDNSSQSRNQTLKITDPIINKNSNRPIFLENRNSNYYESFSRKTTKHVKFKLIQMKHLEEEKIKSETSTIHFVLQNN